MFPCYTANKHMRLLIQVYGTLILLIIIDVIISCDLLVNLFTSVFQSANQDFAPHAAVRGKVPDY